MPKHTFTNSQPIPVILEAGDYILKVVEVVDGISKGAKTSGAEQLEIKFEEDGTGKTVYETLIFHPSLAWKIDCFVQCFGIEAKEGEDIELDAEALEGRKGWVALKIETHNDKKRNRVAMFYTDREKFEQDEILF